VTEVQRGQDMDVDFPRFVEDLVHEGAAAAGTDVLTYLCALVCEDSNRRDEAKKNPPRRLPEVAPEERERALQRVLEQRAMRLSRERIIPMSGREQI
jgi:hypothetical protein